MKRMYTPKEIKKIAGGGGEGGGTVVYEGGEAQDEWNADKKLNKVNLTGNERAYTIDTNGNQKTTIFSSENLAGTIVKRDGEGKIKASMPSDRDDVVNLEYFDTIVEEKVDKTNEGMIVYGTDGRGDDKNYKVATTAVDGAIPMYTGNRTIVSEDPVNDNDVATKKYVDEHGGGGEGGTVVKVNGEAVATWNADTKIDLVVANAKFADLDEYDSKLDDKINKKVETQDFEDYQETVTDDINDLDTKITGAEGRLDLVEQDLANKVSTTTDYNVVYGTDGAGAAKNYNVTASPTEGLIPLFEADGRLIVGTPVRDSDAATKKYVDDAVAGGGGGGGTLWFHTFSVPCRASGGISSPVTLYLTSRYQNISAQDMYDLLFDYQKFCKFVTRVSFKNGDTNSSESEPSNISYKNDGSGSTWICFQSSRQAEFNATYTKVGQIVETTTPVNLDTI